jgi:hypothetical protein
MMTFARPSSATTCLATVLSSFCGAMCARRSWSTDPALATVAMNELTNTHANHTRLTDMFFSRRYQSVGSSFDRARKMFSQ